MVAQTADFKKAVEDSRKLKAKPSDDELLQVRKKHQTHEGEANMEKTDWNGYSSTGSSSRELRTLPSSPLTSPACSISR
jgi:hypothetical protein